MTFIDYLKSQGIDSNSPGAEGIVYATIAANEPDIGFREAELLFAELPVAQDMFVLLWSEYEDVLDLLRPIEGSEIDSAGIYNERCNREPEDVYTITGRVLLNIARRTEEKKADNTY